MVDFLSLHFLVTEHYQVDPPLEAENKEMKEQDCLHSAWTRLQFSLKYFLGHSLSFLPLSHDTSSLVSILEPLCGKNPKSHSPHLNFIHEDGNSEQREVLLTAVCKKISQAMKEIVCVVSQDQLSAILKNLFSEVQCSVTASSCLPF